MIHRPVMHKVLYILCERKAIIVSFVNSKKRQTVILPDAVLTACDQLLIQEHLNVHDIKGIVVIMDDVSFTKSRQTVAMVNTLMSTLHIPAVMIKNDIGQSRERMIAIGLKKLRDTKHSTILKPIYYAPPTITKPRRKFA